MEETPYKRQREETQLVEDPKRHKSYNHILSLLEDDDDEPNLDLSYILTTLQREIDPLSLPGSEPDPDGDNPTSGPARDSEEERERLMTMRHLLEASDDELGIPNRSSDGGDEEGINGGDGLLLCDWIWELEGETANYYSLLQSQLSM